MTAQLLQASGLGRRAPAAGGRPGGWLLRAIGLRLDAGECVAITGPSGAGKSVLLRALAGLDALDEGAIRFCGRPLDDVEMTSYRSQVMYFHQRPALGETTVEEALRSVFSLRAHRAGQYDRAAVEHQLRLLGRDASLLARPTTALSGGEQQLVALLRMLQLQPRALLLDEPTASLDADATRAIEDLIAAWCRDDGERACFWVSHDQAQVRRVAARTVRLEAGRLVREEVLR